MSKVTKNEISIAVAVMVTATWLLFANPQLAASTFNEFAALPLWGQVAVVFITTNPILLPLGALGALFV